MKRKLFSLLSLLSTLFLIQSCGKIEQVDPEVQLPNTWKLYQFVVKTSGNYFVIPLSKGKYIDFESFLIDTEQLKFNADGTLEYTQNGSTKKGTWVLSTDKKSVKITDSYKTLYTSKIISISKTNVVFGSIEVDPRKRTSQYTTDEVNIYYECKSALYQIDVYEESYSNSTSMQLGVEFALAK
jgi:hypothetical protein